MRSVLVFLVLLTLQTTSLGDEVVRVDESVPVAAQASSPHSYSSPEEVAVTAQHGAMPLLERTLMVLLAAAAVTFQLRRKYKASHRIWQQRIIEMDGVSLPPVKLPSASFGTGSAVQWQQIH